MILPNVASSSGSLQNKRVRKTRHEEEACSDISGVSDLEYESDSASSIDTPVSKKQDHDSVIPLAEVMMVIVEYEGELFPGKVAKLQKNGVNVTCMQKAPSTGSTWRWPKLTDMHTYPLQDIKQRGVNVTLIPGTERSVEFYVETLNSKWGKPMYI